MSLKTYTVPLTIISGTTAISTDTKGVPITGFLKGVAVTAGAMDGSDTYTVSITDEHGITVFSRGSLAESTTSTIWADKYNELGTTKVEGSLLHTPLAGPVTVTITASAQQDDADVSYTVYIYYE